MELVVLHDGWGIHLPGAAAALQEEDKEGCEGLGQGKAREVAPVARQGERHDRLAKVVGVVGRQDGY